MNRIKKAIIMAAGIGERMKPLTLNLPKPLVNVNGKRMIETIVETLLENNIIEIYVVVGYMKEMFCFLPIKYKEVVLIENKDYDKANNISSLYYAKDYLGDCLIIDGDQIINNKDILYLDFDCSGYNCIYTKTQTKEWILDVDDDGYILGCNRNGGKSGHQLFSISRWNLEDGLKLKRHLELEYDINKCFDLYWDDVVMFKHFDEYKLKFYPMKEEDVIEIDSYDELKMIDKRYI